jgi:hypothetical protein
VYAWEPTVLFSKGGAARTFAYKLPFKSFKTIFTDGPGALFLRLWSVAVHQMVVVLCSSYCIV